MSSYSRLPSAMPLPNEQSPGSVGALIKRFQRAFEADTELQVAWKRAASEWVSGEVVSPRIHNERRKSDTHASLNQVRSLASTSLPTISPSLNPTKSKTGLKGVKPALEPPSSPADVAVAAAAAIAAGGVSSSDFTLDSNTNSSNVEQPTTVEHPVSTPPNSASRRSGTSSNITSFDENLLDAASSPVATEFTPAPLINDVPQVSETEDAPFPPLPAASSPRLALATTGPAELLLSPSLNNDSSSNTQEGNQGVKTVPGPSVTEEDAGGIDGNEEQDNIHIRSDLERHPNITTTVSKSTIPQLSSPLYMDGGCTDAQQHLLPEQQAANEPNVSDYRPTASNSSNVGDGNGVTLELRAMWKGEWGRNKQTPLVHGETRSSASLPQEANIVSGPSGTQPDDVPTGYESDATRVTGEQEKTPRQAQVPVGVSEQAEGQDPPQPSSQSPSFSKEENKKDEGGPAVLLHRAPTQHGSKGSTVMDVQQFTEPEEGHAKSTPPEPDVESLLLLRKQESSWSPPHQPKHNDSPIGPREPEETDPLPRNEEDRIPEGQMEALMSAFEPSSVRGVGESGGVSGKVLMQEQEQRSVNERKEPAAAKREVITQPSQSVRSDGDVKQCIKQMGHTQRPITTSANKTHDRSDKATTSRSSHVGERPVGPTVPPRLKAVDQRPLNAERKSTVQARITSQRPPPTSLSSSAKPSALAALSVARRTSSTVGGRTVSSATGLGEASLARPTGILPPQGARSVTTGQCQTRDSGAFTRGSQPNSTVAATSLHTACTAISKGTARPPAHAQQLITPVHRSQATINQPAKPLLRSLPTSSVTDTTPQKSVRTSLYAATASSLAKARSQDTNKNMVSVVHKAGLGGGQRIRGGGLARREL
ncbi:hypothetical protein QFC22_001236 [Naganishia vaughanmartiniae]|uniref:Uncharacterized protein n=1 Tax=Naganishia vaughanmartiniae TaxID=1424756 RepID=A0ACC2XJY9_9TREE|nr:hypothetical protein QFC22_001236 [Naganishia vaughanmartiniae]